jgi:NAD(P)-dependent dehydrogenase (short-subunit alcohol dehydrogenase family)/acyl dehydratase
MFEGRIYSAEDLRPGLKVTYEVAINEEDILTFARLTGDYNPLHVDVEYALNSNYEGRIVHGAFQVGLASALLGMHLPGKRVLLGTVNSRFPLPLYFPCRVRLIGEIASWNSTTGGGKLRVLIQETSSLNTTAEVFMGFTLHEEKKQSDGESQSDLSDTIKNDVSLDQKLILLTGASGGLGTRLLSALAAQYQVLAVVNRKSLPNGVGLPNVQQVYINLSAPGFDEDLSAIIGARKLYGLVHAAWPGAPRGSLLQADDEAINNQVSFGTTVTVRLAKILFDRAHTDGGRFIAIGSTAGSFRPYLPLGVYSLAKACLENTVRLLAPELARKKVAINAVCPSFMPLGINKQASQRQIMMESATIPMGRACTVADVAGTIDYLLSPEASFVSGQTIMLTGGQL